MSVTVENRNPMLLLLAWQVAMDVSILVSRADLWTVGCEVMCKVSSVQVSGTDDVRGGMQAVLDCFHD